MKYSIKKRIFIYSLPLIVSAIVIIIEKLYIKYIASLNIPCFFQLLTGYMCAGCGGTRSLKALFSGDIMNSLRYNPAPVLIIIILLLAYIQLIMKSNGSRKRILPGNDNYIIWIVLIMIIYYIARNFIPFLII